MVRNMNPISGLLRSRKFLVAIFDLLVSFIMHFGTKYLAPVAFEDIQFVIASVQPVFLLVIYTIAYEDKGKADNASRLEIAKLQTVADVRVAQAEKDTARIEAVSAEKLQDK